MFMHVFNFSFSLRTKQNIQIQQLTYMLMNSNENQIAQESLSSILDGTVVNNCYCLHLKIIISSTFLR